MRTELTHRQTDIIALGTELERHAAPGNELRLDRKGRLYAKSGKRHTDGKSRSRLTYQERGAAFLREGVRQTLRERGVYHVQSAALKIMSAARPQYEERANEPNRYLVRHGLDMSHIIGLADQLVTRGLQFEAALERIIDDWAHLSRMDMPQRLKRLEELSSPAAADLPPGDDKKHAVPVRDKEKGLTDAAIEPLDISQFERKRAVETPQRPNPGPMESRPQSAAAQAERDAQVQWHASVSVFDNRQGGLSGGELERKHGPRRSEGSASPHTPSSTSAVVVHTPPDRKHVTDRAARRLDDIQQGVAGADYLVEQIRRDEVPHLVPLLRQRAAALMASQATARDSKAQVTDWLVWRNLARFCGQACLDDGAGTHAFTRADVLKLPLEQRFNMLASLDDTHPFQPGQAAKEPAADNAQVLATILQAQGLASAFSEQELLPPTDEVRANALKARLHAIIAAHPGAPFTADVAKAVIAAHHDAYQLTGKPLAVVPATTLKAPFLLSEDRRTLRVSTTPRPANEVTGDVLRQLVGELTRNYQQQLVQRMNSGALEETDDRFILAAILQACSTQRADIDLLARVQQQPPAGARSRHAQLHAARTVVS